MLVLSRRSDGGETLEPLTSCTTNPAGAAIVNTVGPIRQIVRADVPDQRRSLVIVRGSPDKAGEQVPVQVN